MSEFVVLEPINWGKAEKIGTGSRRPRVDKMGIDFRQYILDAIGLSLPFLGAAVSDLEPAFIT